MAIKSLEEVEIKGGERGFVEKKLAIFEGRIGKETKVVKFGSKKGSKAGHSRVVKKKGWEIEGISKLKKKGEMGALVACNSRV